MGRPLATASSSSLDFSPRLESKPLQCLAAIARVKRSIISKLLKLRIYLKVHNCLCRYCNPHSLPDLLRLVKMHPCKMNRHPSSHRIGTFTEITLHVLPEILSHRNDLGRDVHSLIQVLIHGLTKLQTVITNFRYNQPPRMHRSHVLIHLSANRKRKFTERTLLLKPPITSHKFYT